jgi:hypothetical protein
MCAFVRLVVRKTTLACFFVVSRRASLVEPHFPHFPPFIIFKLVHGQCTRTTVERALTSTAVLQ